ncbi:MAG: TatD family hydrolase [Beijerinckiaceae bacterium]
MLIDSHCHLDFPDLAQDRDAVLMRARAAGIGIMLTISTHVARFGHYAAIAEEHADVFCTVGTHPHNAGEEPDIAVGTLVELSRHPRCVAIGEAGLDFFYDKAPRDIQEKVFRTHIAAARDTQLPLIIHARDADDVMIAILREEHGRGAFPAVLHCFSSGEAVARCGVELGFLVSFSGILTFKNSDEIRRIAAQVPRDQLLVETDAPYLAPVPFRGKRNEPAFVAHTAKALADVHGVSAADMSDITTANFLRYFPKAAAQIQQRIPSSAA